MLLFAYAKPALAFLAFVAAAGTIGGCSSSEAEKTDGTSVRVEPTSDGCEPSPSTVNQGGAPLTGNAEFDTPDFAKVVDGEPVIPANARIRLAAHEQRRPSHPEARLLLHRRHRTGHRPARRRLVVHKHTSSAVFACPPGLALGQTWADHLT